MPVKVGLAGLGAMGATHLKALRAMDIAEVVALCDVRRERLEGDFRQAGGNIDTGANVMQDISGARCYTSFARMLRQDDIQAVALCVPTFLHAPLARQALRAGKHVFCEKPLAVSSRQARGMLAAATETAQILMIGQVLRFWREYVMIKEMIDSQRYGRVLSASMSRFGGRPRWSWQDWYSDPRRSGSAALDLHIHDSDTVQWFFGTPAAVSAVGVANPAGGYDQIFTHYHYADGPAVSAEGGWCNVPFYMAATVSFEQAVVEYHSKRSPTLTVHPVGGEAFSPPVAPGRAYDLQMRYFLECVTAECQPQRITAQAAADAVSLVEAEMRAARLGRPVKLGR